MPKFSIIYQILAINFYGAFLYNFTAYLKVYSNYKLMTNKIEDNQNYIEFNPIKFEYLAQIRYFLKNTSFPYFD